MFTMTRPAIVSARPTDRKRNSVGMASTMDGTVWVITTAAVITTLPGTSSRASG